MSAAVGTEAEVEYNTFAPKLSEALEVLGFTHYATEDNIEFWTIQKAHGIIEVSVDYVNGESFVEVASNSGVITKQVTIPLNSNQDCRRVVQTAV